MKQTDETKKKTAAPAAGAEAPEAETPLPDAATDAVSGGGYRFFAPRPPATYPGKDTAR